MSRVRGVLRALFHLPGWGLIALVRLYQFFLSPIVGRQCRFEPSCSNYFIQAVRKYGAVCGCLKGVWRIIRCNPWNPGGHDPP
jgi:putative membrane protein insertion efficiency factor